MLTWKSAYVNTPGSDSVSCHPLESSSPDMMMSKLSEGREKQRIMVHRFGARCVRLRQRRGLFVWQRLLIQTTNWLFPISSSSKFLSYTTRTSTHPHSRSIYFPLTYGLPGKRLDDVHSKRAHPQKEHERGSPDRASAPPFADPDIKPPDSGLVFSRPVNPSSERATHASHLHVVRRPC